MDTKQHKKWTKEYREWIDSLFPIIVPNGYQLCPTCNGEGELEYMGDVWPVVDYCTECEGEGFVKGDSNG